MLVRVQSTAHFTLHHTYEAGRKIEFVSSAHDLMPSIDKARYHLPLHPRYNLPYAPYLLHSHPLNISLVA